MTAPATTALRLSRTTVAQYLSSHQKLTDVLSAPQGNVTLLLRGEPTWEGDAVLALTDGRAVRVVAAPSPLAVHEQILAHAREISPDPRVQVLITDVEEHDLDPAILARTHRARIYVVDQWDIVRETFGAKSIDPMLRRMGWVCEALLDASGARKWPTALAGEVLSRTPTLAALAARRLDLGDLGDRIDAQALLSWSQRPGGPQLLVDLRGPERDGLIDFLSDNEQSGPTGRVLAALACTGHGNEAVAYGLVCAALWKHATPSNPVYQARGRVERWLGDTFPIKGEALDRVLTSFGVMCEEYIADLLTKARSTTDPGDEADEQAREARKTTDTVLGQADLLVRQFGATEAATSSPVLTAGLEARFAAAGNALGRGRIDAIGRSVQQLRDHKLAPDHQIRISRVRMAQRLTHWLDRSPDPTVDTVAAAINRQMHDTAWADRALDFLEAGGDDDPALRVAYRDLATKVRALRREFDREFATALAEWTRSGSTPGSMLTVETFLHRVVRPIAAEMRVMLIVLDGMSAAIATELAGELRKSFAEYDPVPGNGRPQRRAMIAALPSLTAVSRTSLFAGALMKGDQKDEDRLFPAHKFWKPRTAEVFHKHDLRSAAGDRFGSDLLAALADPDKHIAVVLNTIDDRLAKEIKLDDSGWEAREVGDLRALVTVAAGQGMAVLITSDHGHVIDRHGVGIEAIGIGSARHRVPAAEYDRLAESEIALRGPRVVWPEPDAAIVALWDNDSRYTTQKAGYHGGASIAEMTIPILAFLPFGSDPKGWQELGDQRPSWWKDDTDAGFDVPEMKAVAATAKRAERKAKDKITDQITLDLPLPTETVSAPPSNTRTVADILIERLLNSDVFAAQLETVARKPPTAKVEKAVRALLDGPQSTTALAQRVGDSPARARSFAAVLTQLLNVDGAQVVETLSDGRTLRLHPDLLRDQFRLR
ncbi:BREX-2 system phosphatase PglZ [Nocardia nova]|uniref:BREX-2 system phosphatase PglZ n=1 Tax=Nocardia nova TaxID=37330 RepID=UPI000CE9F77E|nr:BREX-2 system phosphatase PglZ [Nocardia nova]PPJ31751.1 BREX-2 system phosphatase PglZ [Nocardia nova]